MIRRFDFKTPGREDDETETKLYTKADVAEKNRKSNEAKSEVSGNDVVSAQIIEGLGGKDNITDIDCCATRLRCTVNNPDLVDDDILKSSGALGIIHKGDGIQVVYGPRVSVIKSNLQDYLDKKID